MDWVSPKKLFFFWANTNKVIYHFIFIQGVLGKDCSASDWTMNLVIESDNKVKHSSPRTSSKNNHCPAISSNITVNWWIKKKIELFNLFEQSITCSYCVNIQSILIRFKCDHSFQNITTKKQKPNKFIHIYLIKYKYY